MHIHDELGHCLLATTKAITEDRLAENADVLRENWNSAIHDFSNISTVWTRARFLSQSELMQVAELIGCKVIFLGEQPHSAQSTTAIVCRHSGGAHQCSTPCKCHGIDGKN